jgi:hypothetical protein
MDKKCKYFSLWLIKKAQKQFSYIYIVYFQVWTCMLLQLDTVPRKPNPVSISEWLSIYDQSTLIEPNDSVKHTARWHSQWRFQTVCKQSFILVGGWVKKHGT